MFADSYVAVLILSATAVTCVVKLNRTHICDLKVDYVISNTCTEHKSISIIQIVTSYAGNFQKRQVLRDIYSQLQLANLGIYRVFLLASTTNRTIQAYVTEENHKYQDIVQGDFTDAYRNLTIKNLMGLRWVTLECPQVSFVVKSDDDVLIDIESLKNLIELKMTPGVHLMGCLFSRIFPVRDKNSTWNKWYVTTEEFKGDVYPPFLTGFLIVFTSAAAKRIFNASSLQKCFFIDDVFLTGILAKNNQFKIESVCSYITKNPNKVQRCLTNHSECDFVAGVSSTPQQARLFKLYLDTHPARDPICSTHLSWTYCMIVCLSFILILVCVYAAVSKLVRKWLSKYRIYC